MEKLILNTTKNGRSVFANTDIKKGDFIIEFRGKHYTAKDIPRGFNSSINHYLQIGKDLYLGPVKSLDNYINHSCNPNCGLVITDKVLLYAIKDIEKGDEITFDYSTTMDEDGWEMDCNCGKEICRKRIRDFKYLPKDIQEYYIRLGIVPHYILENLN